MHPCLSNSIYAMKKVVHTPKGRYRWGSSFQTFLCGWDMGAHACRWSKWKQKIQDDSETRNWMAANTKPCPKCGKPVEKNGGCNLVVCQCRQVNPSPLSTPLPV